MITCNTTSVLAIVVRPMGAELAGLPAPIIMQMLAAMLTPRDAAAAPRHAAHARARQAEARRGRAGGHTRSGAGGRLTTQRERGMRGEALLYPSRRENDFEKTYARAALRAGGTGDSLQITPEQLGFFPISFGV